MNLGVFGRNTGIYAVGNGCARAAAFLLIPLYTHSLSLRDYGLLSTLLITIQGMVIVMGLGTQKGFMRFASEYEGKNLIGELLGCTMVLTIAGSCAVTVVCLLFLLPFFQRFLHSNEVRDYVILTCAASLFQVLYTHMTSYFRARNEGSRFVAANLAALLFLIAANFVFLRVLEKGVKGVLLAQIMAYGSLWGIVFIGLIARIGVGFSLELTRKLFGFSFPMLFAMSWSMVMDTSAIYFLGYFGSLEQVAIFSLGYKISQIALIVLILPFQLAYEPFVYSNFSKPGIETAISKLLTYLMLGYAFVAFGIVFVSRPLLSVIAPPEYFSAYTVIFLMLPGIAFIGVYYVAESLLSIKNKTSLIGGVVTISTVMSLVLNYFLIPLWGMYGAIFVVNVTLVLTALILMVKGVKVFPIQLEKTRLGVIGAFFLFFLLFVFILRDSQAYIFYTAIPLVACTMLAILFFSNFMDDREKAAVRNFLRSALLMSFIK